MAETSVVLSESSVMEDPLAQTPLREETLCDYRAAERDILRAQASSRNLGRLD